VPLSFTYATMLKCSIYDARVPLHAIAIATIPDEEMNGEGGACRQRG